jgi:hypothetical protein
MHRTHLDANPSRRVPTGILTIGDDAPAVFIRGEDAAAMAKTVELYLDYHEIPLSSHPPIKDLIDFLHSCDKAA